MSTPTAYRLTRDRFEHKAGTTVYSLRYSDYGCANMDSRQTGVDHIAVTLNPDGDYPSFTVPKQDLEPVAAVPADATPGSAASGELAPGAADPDDFPLGKACDITDGTCEACQ